MRLALLSAAVELACEQAERRHESRRFDRNPRIGCSGNRVLGPNGMEVEKELLETAYKDRTVAVVKLTVVLYDTLAIRRQIDLAQEAITREESDSVLDKIRDLDASATVHGVRIWPQASRATSNK